MIKVRCFTNLDGYRDVRWPTTFCCRPQCGDTVVGYGPAERDPGGKHVLTIVQVRHTSVYFDGDSDDSYLEIELHKKYGGAS